MRAPVVEGLPYFYTVHLNRPCNQQCIMCLPVGKFPAESLSFDEFVATFDQIRPVAQHITLIGGEPFMYPHLHDVLELLAAHPIAVSINTNATLFRPETTERLLALHELNLKCSIDAATRETYRRIRGRDTFDRVMGNLREFSAAAAGLGHVRQILVFVVMRENLDEVVPFVDLAASIRPARIEFHPVRQVVDWKVSNGTGWDFDGRQQSCEFFRDDYNAVIEEAAARSEALGIECETLLL